MKSFSRLSKPSRRLNRVDGQGAKGGYHSPPPGSTRISQRSYGIALAGLCFGDNEAGCSTGVSSPEDETTGTAKREAAQGRDHDETDQGQEDRQ